MNQLLEQSAYTDFWASLSDAFPFQIKREKDKSAILICERHQWVEIHQQLHSNWGFFFLFDLYVVDQKDSVNNQARFLLISHLIHLEDFLQLTVQIPLENNEHAPSLHTIWPQTQTYQDEISKRFRVLFDRDELKFLKYQNFMRKDWAWQDLKSESSQSPTLFDYYHYEMNSDGRVIGFNFATDSYCLGIEKMAEQMSLPRFLPCFERINPSASAFYSLALCRLIEDAHQIKISERDQAIRMIITELNRVLDHMSCLYRLFNQIELLELAVKCLKAREIIFRLYAGLSNHRSPGGLIEIGGLSFDIKLGWIADCSKNMEELTVIADELLSATSRSWQWMNLTRVDPTSAKDALKFGLTGPALRACGVNYDLRKIEPYYFYADLAFEVPMGINGDIYDRGLVRIEEMRESLKIIFQLIDNLPRKVNDDLDLGHSKHKLSFLDKIYKMSAYGQLLNGSYHLGVESSNGHLGLSIVSNGTDLLSRLRIRTPSEAHREFLELKCIGVDSDDLNLILASYNISYGEMER